MRYYAFYPVRRENNPNGVSPKSAKSTRAMLMAVALSAGVSACGDDHWWHESRIPDPATANSQALTPAAAKSKSGTVGRLAPANPEATTTAKTASTNSSTSATTTASDKSGTTSTDTSASDPSGVGTQASVQTGTAPDQPSSGASFPQGIPGPTGDYKLAGYDTLFFSDEFNTNELDRSKWCTRFVWGGGPALQVPDAECTKHIGQGTLDYANADEQQRYRDFNNNGEPLHVLGDGTLKLRATKTGTDSYLQYEAAMLNSKMSFKPEGNTSYYITTRMKLPNVLGTWPSIWMASALGADGSAQWPPEIDIFEGPLNNQPETEFTMHQHSQVRGAQTDSGKYEFIEHDPNFDTTWGYYTSPDRTLRDVWLEIAAEWTTDKVCFFIDGFQTACENYRWVTNEGVPAHPATLILNLAVGGPWAGRGGIDAAAFPTQLEVDYVRVYRNN